MTTSQKTLPLVDYERMFRVMKTVLAGVGANTPHACIFFSVTGARLLWNIYGKKCVPVVGAAFFLTDSKIDPPLAFGTIDCGHASSNKSAFHCWIGYESMIIDFMPLLFRELLISAGFSGDCTRRMFEKPLSAMTQTYNWIRKPGDFHLTPNPTLTQEIISIFPHEPFRKRSCRHLPPLVQETT